ncbi:hypothetical protein CJF32_00009484 [Rutstroemia sp. NJR-2017a WRK4]|nr:hypothetical protein CJF32_00009484 [Rutstroemia sp. NJR-2017a WRK4]
MSLTSKRERHDNLDGDVPPETDQPKRQRAKMTSLQSCDLSVPPVHAIRNISAGSTSFEPSKSPQQFGYSESEIQLLRVIGSGDHAIVYRISAGDKTFALKIHKYDNKTITQSGSQKSNIFFQCIHAAFPTEMRPIGTIPRYYGYINFTKPPFALKPGKRQLFKSSVYRPAVYIDFLMDRVDDKDIEQDPWRKYFMNESGGCILQRVVLGEIFGPRSLIPADGENMAILESGHDGLEALHRRGVLHGDVKNLNNAMVTKDNRIT